MYARNTAAFAVVSREMECLGCELNFQTFVIYRFEKAAAFVFVYSKADANDGVAFRLVNQFSTLFFSCHFVCFVGKNFRSGKLHSK